MRRVRLSTVLLLAILGGCSRAADAPAADVDAARTSDFLALGDSYTIGEGVARDDRWPVQLARSLRDAGLSIDDPRIIATTGWTCADLSAALDREPAGKTYKIVSLLIGVNDEYRHGTPERYRGQFNALTRRAIALAGGDSRHVLVLSIPDWGATPFGAADDRGSARIGSEIDAFNAIARAEAATVGVRYVDITAVSREVKHDPALAAADGLHPTAAMYAKWTALALPLAREIVAK